MTDREVCMMHTRNASDSFTIRRFHDSGHNFFRMFTPWGGQIWQEQHFWHTQLLTPMLILLAQEHGELSIEHEDINAGITITITPSVNISGVDFNV